MIKNIKLTEEYFEKNGNRWERVEHYERTIDEEWHKNVVDAKKFFQNIGGTEKHTRARTKFGTKVVKVESINPGHTLRHTWEFDFADATNE